MIKRIIIYVAISSLISAGLLYLGITVMGQYSPALASSLNALVAPTNVQNPPKAILAADNFPLTVDQSGDQVKLQVSSLPNPDSNFPVEYNQSLKTSENSISAGASDAEITIAQLLSNSDLFRNRVITIAGIATSLGDDKVLLNDGTGQILVELEDDLVGLAAINGLPITVMGTLDDASSLSSFELEACALTDQNGTVFIDDCKDDDDDGDDDDDNDNDDD
jgi:uncharacterized protein YdeI (BOF family)